MKKYIIVFLIISGIILPAVSFAGLPDFNGPLVICGRSSDSTPCSLCDIFLMAQKMIDFIIGLIVIIAPILIAVGGFMILLGGANPGQVDTGKKIIKNAIIGIIIALVAWTLINMVFLALAGGDKGVGKIFNAPWNEIKCEGGGIIPDENKFCSCGENSTVGSKEYSNGTDCFNECPSYCKETFKTIPGGDKSCCGEKVMEQGCFTSAPPGDWCTRKDPAGSQNWVLSGINPKQKGDANESLVEFINCMYQQAKLHGKSDDFIRINSISDDALCSTPPSCDPKTGTGCAHTKNSCHYGGIKCAGGSSAVDLRANTTTCQILWDWAKYCGADGNAWPNWETNHLHVSLNNGTCQCAESKVGNPCP